MDAVKSDGNLADFVQTSRLRAAVPLHAHGTVPLHSVAIVPLWAVTVMTAVVC